MCSSYRSSVRKHITCSIFSMPPLRFGKEQYKFSMFCFSTLVNSTTLRELVRRVGLMKVLYCSEMESPELKRAYNSIVDDINSLNTNDIQVELEETGSSDHENEENSSSESEDNCAPINPFTEYFKRKIVPVDVPSDGEIKNSYLKPQYFEEIINKWLPMAPFWTCLLLGRY